MKDTSHSRSAGSGDSDEALLLRALQAPEGGLRGFERKSSFAHWLQRIKINHCLNHLKKHKDHTFVNLGDPDIDEFEELKIKVTAEQLAGTIGERRMISAVLDSMPSTLRIALVLCDMD